METNVFAQVLINAGDELANKDINVRSYSGRGMYGKECIALVGQDTESIKEVFAHLINQQIASLCEDVDHDGIHQADVQDFVDTLLTTGRSDSMGTGIVHYWPDVEYPDDDERAGDD